MALKHQATPIGLRSFQSKDKSSTYYVVNVTFEEPGTDGLACASIFVTDTEYADIQARFNDPTFTLDIVRAGKGYIVLL